MSDRILRSVYSLARGEWLRWDSIGWTADPSQAGAWGQKDALALVARASADVRPILVEPPEGD